MHPPCGATLIILGCSGWGWRSPLLQHFSVIFCFSRDFSERCVWLNQMPIAEVMMNCCSCRSFLSFRPFLFHWHSVADGLVWIGCNVFFLNEVLLAGKAKPLWRRMNRCGCANAATNASLHPSQNSDKCISYYLMRSLTSSSRCSSKLHHLISAAVWHEPPLQCVCPAIYWFPRSPQNPNRPTHCILEKWFTMRWITATASFYAIFTPIEGQKQVFYSRWYSFHILVVYTLSSKQTTVDPWKMAHHHHDQQQQHHNHF